MIFIEGKLNQFKFTRQLLLGLFDVFGEAPLQDVIAPSSITNLRASLLPGTDGQVSLAWTAPGGDYDFGIAQRYKVMIHKDILRLRDEAGQLLDGWPSPRPALSIQQHTMTWRQYDQVFYLAMYAVDHSNNAAKLSNVVEIYVPAPKPTSPLTIVTLPNMKQGQGQDPEGAASSPVLASFGATQLIIALLCLAGVVFICAILACYCIASSRKNKAKKEKNQQPKDGFNVAVTVGSKDFGQDKSCEKKDYLRPINSWSPTELLGHHDKRASYSGRSDNNSDHSGSTKKSYGGSSDPPQYYSNGVHYSYEGNSYNDAYHITSDGYPTPIEGYPQNATSYLQNPEGYVAEGYSLSHDGRPYGVSQPSADSFMSESCDMVPGSVGPPGYSAHPYDSRNGLKVPPPIPPKPKVQYAPEPYSYEGSELTGNNSSSNNSVSSEKRVRNVTMV